MNNKNNFKFTLFYQLTLKLRQFKPCNNTIEKKQILIVEKKGVQ